MDGHVHSSPASPRCGFGRRHSPWTASRQRKKNRQEEHHEEHLPVCISEDEGSQTDGAVLADCNDMILDMQNMSMGGDGGSPVPARRANVEGGHHSSLLPIPPKLLAQKAVAGSDDSGAAKSALSSLAPRWASLDGLRGTFLWPGSGHDVCEHNTGSPHPASASAFPGACTSRGAPTVSPAAGQLRVSALSAEEIRCGTAEESCSAERELSSSAAPAGASPARALGGNPGRGGGRRVPDARRRSIKRRSTDASHAGGGGTTSSTADVPSDDAGQGASSLSAAVRLRRRAKAIFTIGGGGPGRADAPLPAIATHSHSFTSAGCCAAAGSGGAGLPPLSHACITAPHATPGQSHDGTPLVFSTMRMGAKSLDEVRRGLASGLPGSCLPDADVPANGAAPADDRADTGSTCTSEDGAAAGSMAPVPPRACTAEPSAAADSMASMPPSDEFRISTVLTGSVAPGELAGSSDKLALRGQHMRTAAAGHRSQQPANASCCLIHLSACLDEEPGGTAACHRWHPRDCPGSTPMACSAPVEPWHHSDACTLGRSGRSQHPDSPWMGSHFGISDPGASPMEGLAVRVLHTEEDFQTPPQSPTAPRGDIKAPSARRAPRSLPHTVLAPFAPRGADARFEHATAEGGALCIKDGAEDGAHHIVSAESLTSVGEFNVQLATAAAAGNRGRANSLLDALLNSGLSPDMRTLNLMLRCMANSLARPDEAECLAREVCLAGDLSPNALTYNLLAETRFRYEQLCHH